MDEEYNNEGMNILLILHTQKKQYTVHIHTAFNLVYKDDDEGDVNNCGQQFVHIVCCASLLYKGYHIKSQVCRINMMN